MEAFTVIFTYVVLTLLVVFLPSHPVASSHMEHLGKAQILLWSGVFTVGSAIIHLLAGDTALNALLLKAVPYWVASLAVITVLKWSQPKVSVGLLLPLALVCVSIGAFGHVLSSLLSTILVVVSAWLAIKNIAYDNEESEDRNLKDA